MLRPLVLLPLALAVSVLVPAVAEAGTGTRTLELVGSTLRSPAPTSSADRFTLAGVHWKGPGRVAIRTRSLAGRWSAWRPAAPEDEDGPDAGSAELRSSRGWRVGNPWWVGPSDRIQARTIGRVSRVRAHVVWSPEIRIPYRVTSAAQQPAIVPRLSWGANESIRRGSPTHAPSVRFAIVHHTAGRNGYTRSEAPAIVRGIQLFHVQGNGWNDIGYNFLVDRFGTVYEGRHGGIDRNVVGAHARGFNTGSIGIALLGTYGGTEPTQAAQDAIARLIAWRLDLAHVDPAGLLTVVSSGSERFAPGVPVPLRVVSGHRDTGSTICPGVALYARLGSIAAAARRTGLPKIFDPRAEENDAGVRFTARLSGSASWAVVVSSGEGAEVTRGSGSGTAVDWTWEAGTTAGGAYRWTITAGSARPATGTIERSANASLAVQEVVAEPGGITPNGDGQADSAVVRFRLTTAANVTVEVLDGTGMTVATPVDRVWMQAGERSVTVDGAALPDGRYNVVITARRADGAEATTAVPLVVSRTLETVAVDPTAFSPNADGRNDRVTVTFSLAAPAEVRVRVLREGRGVASLHAGPLPSGRQRLVWAGVRKSGSVRDGEYSVAVEARDTHGRIAFAVPLVVDTVAPRVRIVPGRRVRVEVSEPAVLRLRVAGTTIRREVERAGVVTIPWRGQPARVRVVAIDAAGNVSAPAVRPAPGRARPGQ